MSFRKWVVAMIGCAKVFGTSKAQSQDAYGHLAKMSELENPLEYDDGNGGVVKPLNGNLQGWHAYKKSAQKRYEAGHNTRIVLRPDEEQRKIEVIAFGNRDGDEVYIHASRNLAAQNRKVKK